MPQPLNRRAPSKTAQLIAACRDDFPRLCYDGFGIMLSDEQIEAHDQIGVPGPRQKGEAKSNWLSGGTRSGKTVWGSLTHFDANLYKRGVDVTDSTFWRNYDYGTLHIAPTDELALRLWAIADSISKGSNDAQYDRKARQSRGGALLNKMTVGKQGRWGIIRYVTGGHTDFRSSEGKATRLEGGQWWWCTWDEWASQPDREIEFVRKDVLLARLRDHDGKLCAMAWPKAETEHHLIEVIRAIESGEDLDSKVVYMSAESAFFTNASALEVEKRQKDKASYSRTVLGRPAGGAAVEFKPHMLTNMFDHSLRMRVPRESGFAYLSTFDIGLAHDPTVGLTFRIPIVGGKRVVTPDHKARIVNTVYLPGGDDLTPDTITYEIGREQAFYRSQVAIDATGMGGLMAFRQVKDMNPRPLAFSSRSNDRIYGNMRLAAITNALDVLEWGKPEPELDPEGLIPWGLIEAPWIVRLNDQMLWFDRDEERPDDWVWAFNIGCWYIRRFWAQGVPGKRSASAGAPQSFDVRDRGDPDAGIVRKRKRGRLISMESPVEINDGQVFIRDGKRYVPPGLRRR
jgi:hypothetical protein